MRSKKRVSKMTKALVVLLRNTTWKCGKVERLAVNYLRKQLHVCGRPKVPLNEMLQYFKLDGKQKSEFFDAMMRLEKRMIIRILPNPPR